MLLLGSDIIFHNCQADTAQDHVDQCTDPMQRDNEVQTFALMLIVNDSRTVEKYQYGKD